MTITIVIISRYIYHNSCAYYNAIKVSQLFKNCPIWSLATLVCEAIDNITNKYTQNIYIGCLIGMRYWRQNMMKIFKGS